MVPQD